MDEAGIVAVYVGMKDRPEQDGLHLRLGGAADDFGASEGEVIVVALGGDAEVLAPIACDGKVHALETEARLVDLVKAGVSVAGVDLVFVRLFRLIAGVGTGGRGNLAGGRQGQKRGRNQGQKRKQKHPLQLETLLNTVLWPGCLMQGFLIAPVQPSR